MAKKILLWIFVLFLLISSVSAYDIETNLYAWFNFSTDLNDSSGNINPNVTMTTTGMTYTAGCGKNGNGGQFDGSTSWFNFSYDPVIGFRNSTVGSIVCLWVNSSISGFQTIMESQYSGSNDVGIQFFYDGSAQLDFYTDNTIRIANRPITHASYNHICLVDNTTHIVMFINNTIQGSTTVYPTGTNGVEYGTLSESSFLNGCMDELAIYGNASNYEDLINELWNDGAGTFFPVLTEDTLNITATLPANNTQYSTNSMKFNATVQTNNTFNCTLYINDTLNTTNTTGESFDITIANGDYTYFIGCDDGQNPENSTTYEFYIDSTDPVITDNFTNNSVHYLNNLVGEFNFTDNIILFSYNISIDDSQIAGLSNIGNNSARFVLNYDIQNLSAGSHNLSIRIADGHTAKELGGDYEITKSNYLKYDFYDEGYIKTESKTRSNGDKWNSIRKTDRYIQIYEPLTPSDTYTFIEESDIPIYIMDKEGHYNDRWLVIGNHWKDYVIEGEPNAKVSFKRINDYKVEVTISGIKNKDKLIFNSIGDLNIITQNYTFIKINATETFSSPVMESTLNTFQLNVTNPSGDITDLEVNLTYNNTIYTTTETASADSSIFSVDITSPLVNTDTNISFNWTISADNTTFNTSTNLQLVLDLNISDCSTGNDILLNFTHLDEENQTEINTSDIEIDLTITNSQSGQTWNYSNSTNQTHLAVCLPAGTLNNMTLATYPFTIDIIAEYTANNYVQEFWHLDNGTVDNSSFFNAHTPIKLNLFNLISIDSTSFLFEFTDEFGLEVDNAIIHTFRQYIGEGEFKEIERSRQDENGETHIHLVEEDVIYSFTVTQYGNIIFVSDTYNAKCLSTPCQIQLKATTTIRQFSTDWENINGALYNIETNSTTRVSTLSIDSNVSDTFNYTLYRYNGTLSVVNSSTFTGTTGSISLLIPTSYGNDTYIGAIFRSDEFITSEWLDLTYSARDYFGSTGAILGAFILMAFGLMAITEGIILIFSICLILFLLGILMLVDLGWFAIISIICAGGIIAWAITKKKKNG